MSACGRVFELFLCHSSVTFSVLNKRSSSSSDGSGGGGSNRSMLKRVW